MAGWPLKVVVAVLALATCSSVVISTDTEAPVTEPPKIPRPNHRDLVDSDLLALYDMTNFFLEDMIQPRYLTWLSEKKGLDLTDKDALQESFENDYWYWVEYWVGFTICAVIGVLAILVMPIVGISIACCRCCGNCGGKTDPNEGKHSTCKRVCCGVSLVVVTCFLLAGSVLVFVLNDAMRDRMQGDSTVFDELSVSFNSVDKFLDTTVQDLNHTVLDGYIAVKNDVFVTLDHIPQDALGAIEDKTGVVTAFKELDEFVIEGLPSLNHSLTKANDLILELRGITDNLGTDLEDVKTDILTSISNCATTECDDARDKVEKLALDANFTVIDVEKSLTAVTYALGEGIVDHVKEVEAALVHIAETVNVTVWSYTTEAKKVADDVEKEISIFVSDVANSVDSLDFDAVTEAMDDAKEAVDWPWDIVYWSIVALGIIVLVIVLCNVVGVCSGSFGSRPDPDSCGCNRAWGADWLLAGIGFTFIFYWLLIMVVMVIFVAGGLFHTEACRHLVGYEDPDSREVLGVMDHWINDSIYESTDGDVSIMFTDVYESCQRNKSFYAALELEDKFDLDEILDLTPVEEALDQLKNATDNIDIGHVDVYPSELQTLVTLMDDAFESELDFEAFYAELDKDITNYDLDELADELDDLIGQPGVNNASLAQQTVILRNLTIKYVEPAENLVPDLRSQLKNAEDTLATISLSDINKTLTDSEVVINSEGNAILQEFVIETADEVYDDIDTFVRGIDEWIRYYCGNCWPMYDALTSAIDSSCVTTLYPLNGFWYSLGMCIFFLIPSIIIAFALVTEYRKTIKYHEHTAHPYGDDDGDRLYDAYKTEDYFHNEPNSRLMMETMNENQAMSGADNPIYIPEDFHIPRPSVHAAAAYSSAGYPASSYPEKKHSPPPSYVDSFPGDNQSWNTKM